jgi:Ricin-type beta-trefoil lectin domain-like
MIALVRRWRITGALIAALAAAVIGPASAQANAYNLEFKNLGTGLCMSVAYNDSPDWGYPVVQATCWGGVNQHWDFTRSWLDGRGVRWGHIVNRETGLCLAVRGGSHTSGVGLMEWPCGNWADHWWRIQPAMYAGSIPAYHLVNMIAKPSGPLCAAIPGGTHAAGASVIQWPCGTWADHYWFTGTSF